MGTGEVGADRWTPPHRRGETNSMGVSGELNQANSPTSLVGYKQPNRRCAAPSGFVGEPQRPSSAPGEPPSYTNPSIRLMNCKWVCWRAAERLIVVIPSVPSELHAWKKFKQEVSEESSTERRGGEGRRASQWDGDLTSWSSPLSTGGAGSGGGGSRSSGWSCQVTRVPRATKLAMETNGGTGDASLEGMALMWHVGTARVPSTNCTQGQRAAPLRRTYRSRQRAVRDPSMVIRRM